MITDRQLMEWIESQLPWNIFRQQISTYRDTPDELSGPPRLHRDLPNRTYMYEHTAPYADTLDSFNRISAFLRCDLSWSTSYLTTLPPLVRRFYLNMPPTHSDHLDYQNPRPATTSHLGGGYPTQPTHTAPDSKPHKRERTHAHGDSDTERRRSKQESQSNFVSSSDHHLTHNSVPPQSLRIAEESAYGRPLDGPRPRFPGEDKSTPDLTPSEYDTAASRRADSIRNWYRAHTTPIGSQYSNNLPHTTSSSNPPIHSHNSDTKDPAAPHPVVDHLRAQTTHTPSPPAEHLALTTVTSLGGYHSEPPAPQPSRPF